MNLTREEYCRHVELHDSDEAMARAWGVSPGLIRRIGARLFASPPTTRRRIRAGLCIDCGEPRDKLRIRCRSCLLRREEI